MAKKDKKSDKTPVPQKNDRVGMPGIFHSILVVLLALLVVAVVSLGVFYIAVKNNVNGLADTVRPLIKDHPILKVALPKIYDPDDPEYLTEKELLEKYNEYRVKTKALNESLEEANKTIEQLKNDAKATSDSATILEQNQAVLDAVKLEQSRLEEEKKSLSALIAKGDTKSFRDYFQKVDKVTAEAVYREIVTEENKIEEKAALSKPFSTMEPASAAKVLEELYQKDQQTLLDIFEGFRPTAAALILEEMNAKTAAEITKLLSDRKLGR